MASTVSLPRTLLVYAITIPLALVLGYMLTTPLDMPSFLVVISVAFVLALPLLMRHHHSLLIFAWNAYLSVSFLPGQPRLWMVIAIMSLGFSLLSSILNRQARFIHVPSITFSLLLLGLVVVLTAKLRGGIGLRSLGGSTYGGKSYFLIYLAIIGYFALTAQPIPLARFKTAVATFFLSGLTSLMANLIYLAGPAFFFLYSIFPPDLAYAQAQADFSPDRLARYTGFTTACLAAYCFMLARYGIAGIINFSHPFRFLIFAAIGFMSLIGGFRSAVGWLIILFAVQFVVEGLHRTRLLPVLAGLGLMGFVLLVPLAPRLPIQMQRAISFLPVQVDPLARWDAEGSTVWRLKMWEMLLPELPNYILLGKGYALDPRELWLTYESSRRGYAAHFENSIVAGDYHNGPLSVYIPFGSFGVLAFLLFLGASVRTLYLNYRNGHPALRQVNAFLLTYFIARTIIFVVMYGSLSNELYYFTGLIGLSVALNGGERKAPAPVALPALSPATA